MAKAGSEVAAEHEIGADKNEPGRGTGSMSGGGGNANKGGGGYSGPKGFIGPSDAGLKAAGMPASPGGWTGPDDTRGAMRTGVKVGLSILGSLFGMPMLGAAGNLIPDRTTADRYADTHGYPSGGAGGPGRPGTQGGGTGGVAATGSGRGVPPTGLPVKPAMAPPTPLSPTSPAGGPGTGLPPSPPVATDWNHYGEGREASFFPPTDALTQLAQQIQKLTSKDLTKVDKIDPLTGLPAKAPAPTIAPRTAPAPGIDPRILRGLMPPMPA